MQYRKPKARLIPHPIPTLAYWAVIGSGVECCHSNLDKAIANHQLVVLFNQTNRSGMRVMSADE